jgi:hypothetical protein
MTTGKFFTTSIAGKTFTAALFLTLAFLSFFPMASAAQQTGMVKIDTRLYNSSNVMLDANVVVFNTLYSNAVDFDDAPKMSNPGENIAIQRGSAVLVVEGRQPAVVNDLVPFRMWNMRIQNYRLEFIASNIVTPGLIALLEDTYLNTHTPINPSGSTVVNFSVNAIAASAAMNRFRIVFKQGVALPVTFVSVTANRIANAVQINWKVAGEINIKEYEVQRSVDGRNFSSIGTIPATGNSRSGAGYGLLDASAAAGILFYRISSIGTNADKKYSSIIKLSAHNKQQAVTLFSNPVENRTLQLQFTNQVGGQYNVVLLNTAGQIMARKSLNHSGGNGNQMLQLPANIPGGAYHLLIVAPDHTQLAETILVNNR